MGRVLTNPTSSRNEPMQAGESFKIMVDLAEECLRILNEGHFQIIEPGPLHTPINGFSIRRDEKLTLILETEVASNATSAAIEHPPGTVRISTESVRLRNVNGVEAELSGVVPLCSRTRSTGVAEHQAKKEARVHIAKTHFGSGSTAAYVIDWLENLPVGPFLWPAATRVVTNTTSTRSISLNDGITITHDSEEYHGSHNAAKLTVEDTTFYLCALGCEGIVEGSKRGCIVFDGTPDDGFRKKVRTALSFALGLYLVDLGTTHYDRDWRVVSTLARSAYSLRRQAFAMGPDQPAPLGLQFWGELDPNQLNRAVDAFVSAFDKLDLANLSWAYWHACAATPHIASAQFGAAIEALQSAYIKANPGVVPKEWAPKEAWKGLRKDILTTIEGSSISDEAKAALTKKLDSFNRVDQRPRLRAMMLALGLELGGDEDRAWPSRNNAAHGTPIPEGQELAAIRDVKLLRGLFNRLLLRITDAADQYIDYTSLYCEYRPLSVAPPDTPPS